MRLTVLHLQFIEGNRGPCLERSQLEGGHEPGLEALNSGPSTQTGRLAPPPTPQIITNETQMELQLVSQHVY